MPNEANNFAQFAREIDESIEANTLTDQTPTALAAFAYTLARWVPNPGAVLATDSPARRGLQAAAEREVMEVAARWLNDKLAGVQNLGHVCANCLGIDPDTCMYNGKTES